MTPGSDRPAAPPTAEHRRLAESSDPGAPWRLWGPYLSGRQWGTVREDYSADGDAWTSLPFDQAHQRAYRWGEDGLGGVCDRFGFLNFSIALWNGRDPVLKERLFGLTNGEGNHGEDVKEYWWAVDSTPTHSWMEWLYRYPQAEYPYRLLREANAARGRDEREYELSDTGVLDDNRFFDVAVTYAKAGPDDYCITVTATNHGPDPAELHLLPQLWFRNTWAWGRDPRTASLRPRGRSFSTVAGVTAVRAEHEMLGRYELVAHDCPAADSPAPTLLLCDNETDAVGLYGAERNRTRYAKNGIDRYVVHGDADAVFVAGADDDDVTDTRPDHHGQDAAPSGPGSEPRTKAAFWYRFSAVAPGASVSIRLRLSTDEPGEATFGPDFDAVVADRRLEADEFYDVVIPADRDAVDRDIARRAFAGLLWGKQLYRYTVAHWLSGDPASPAPPAQRLTGRNESWGHLALADVLSMPDEWEYPWFASWDLAFHCVALAHVDPAFAKHQLVLLCREWSMHPNGQLPAYEWEFGDVNPPVHAWATWQVYLIDGRRDPDFLARILSKLLLNFAWWLNRKDPDGSDLFEGGFLGMDNIGLFDRSKGLPPGTRLQQSDATAWMAFSCLQMLTIAVELAPGSKAWDDVATTFLEHFLSIAKAMTEFGSHGISLWDEEDRFFYDVLTHPDGTSERLRVRSMVGLLPLLGVAVPPATLAEQLPDYTARLTWLVRHRPQDSVGLQSCTGPDGSRTALALVGGDRLPAVLSRLFDEGAFLSPHGIRSLSAEYRTPFTTVVDGVPFGIGYEPGESHSGMFGGNSNWRGPVWFPVNALLADALRSHGAFDPDRTVEVPTGSGRSMSLAQAADLLDDRLIGLFRPGPDGRRPSDGSRIEATDDPLWRAHPTFSEYFDGDTGEGLGASHQTGWTALVAHLLCRRPEEDRHG
ncbi:glucosidase [Nakamurella flavida]|uniref:Glucosidase n=1 Tax=Nakamurella flavida TaxID=363630 RepID=A0A938YLR3_9ACTN|nr:glucosidase [Nakamurella flavida]